jgi:hypothetical protein
VSDRELLDVVRRSNTLCLDVSSPGWDDARGYLLDDESQVLYFPVSKKYLPEDMTKCRVLIWNQPRVIVTGKLSPATSDGDAEKQLALAAAAGFDPDKARSMLLDQRTGRVRRIRFKLSIDSIELTST